MVQAQEGDLHQRPEHEHAQPHRHGHHRGDRRDLHGRRARRVLHLAALQGRRGHPLLAVRHVRLCRHHHHDLPVHLRGLQRSRASLHEPGGGDQEEEGQAGGPLQDAGRDHHRLRDGLHRRRDVDRRHRDGLQDPEAGLLLPLAGAVRRLDRGPFRDPDDALGDGCWHHAHKTAEGERGGDGGDRPAAAGCQPVRHEHAASYDGRHAALRSLARPSAAIHGYGPGHAAHGRHGATADDGGHAAAAAAGVLSTVPPLLVRQRQTSGPAVLPFCHFSRPRRR
mmetsp:Transcript_101275/g.227189  ORF Transcript_101275/g.227189 Transcript_101275/m.227189 type:complete len:280 (+) Transcript_101275:287-1126(+)